MHLLLHRAMKKLYYPHKKGHARWNQKCVVIRFQKLVKGLCFCLLCQNISIDILNGM